MLKNYLKHSGIWAGVAFNPYHWQFVSRREGIGELSPKVCGRFISFGPVWIRVVIDDGCAN